MSRDGNGQSIDYKLILSKANARTIKELARRFAQKGQVTEFLDSLRQIYERLRKDPREFGEPLYRLPALKLLVCHVTSPLVVVHYGVHEE